MSLELLEVVLDRREERFVGIGRQRWRERGGLSEVDRERRSFLGFECFFDGCWSERCGHIGKKGRRELEEMAERGGGSEMQTSIWMTSLHLTGDVI